MSDRPRLTLVTDAWAPQINGVAITLRYVTRHLEESGFDVTVIQPGLFRTVKLPKYSEIRFAVSPVGIYRALNAARPDYVHIATEGPLGTVARFWCRRRGASFNSSYHTRFPEYVKRMYGLPSGPVTKYMRWFHGAAESTLAPTVSVKEDLERCGFTNLVVWPRGVDADLFHPSARDPGLYPRNAPDNKAVVYVGRVSKEKSIEDFCELAANPNYQLYVVGDGPHRQALERKFGDRVTFVGFKHGADLARHYASADVMVFPSRTDTFGLVITESMACGTPVAAYPVTGPRDIIADGGSGALDEDLSVAVGRALQCDRDQVRAHALDFTWDACADIFREWLAPV